VKTMKNRKFFRVHTFVWALISLFLLSSIFGIVWAKPGKPPPPPPELYEFKIMIGAEGEDIVLVDPEFLEVEAGVSSCGWYYPYAKGTRGGGWYALLNSLVEPPAGQLGECGYYIVNLQGVPAVIDAQAFFISHNWERAPARKDYLDKDYWEFSIAWNDDPTTMDLDDSWVLTVRTDWDFDPDGTYDSVNEVWEVDFSGASWELIDYDENGYGHVEFSGTISSLTVTIDKIT
jgi:hypothetical protein